MFWENFYHLCLTNNTSPTQVVKKLNIAAGSVTKWKKGALPSGNTLTKIATYFNVTIDFLLRENQQSTDNNHVIGNNNVVGNNNTNCCNNKQEELGDIEEEILSLMLKMDMKQKNALLTRAYELIGE